MKTKFSQIFIFLVLISFEIFSQQSYQKLHGITESNYAIRAELDLNYTYSITVNDGAITRQVGSIAFKSPSFLNFNRNDLLYFKAEPGEFIYDKLQIETNGFFSDSKGLVNETAGFTSIDEHVDVTDSEGNSEISLKGYQLSSVEVGFILSDFAEKVKSGRKDFTFRLTFKHEVCPTCEQKDVTGFIRMLDMMLTDEFRLDGRIVNGQVFNAMLVQALIDNDFIGKAGDDKKKQAFIDKFTDNYFRDMPQVDANRLIDFLINPTGVWEFPIAGFVNSPDGTEKMTYKGTLKLDGENVFNFWKGE